MSIKITSKNATRIEAMLKAANGRAEAHAYCFFSEIAQLAEAAEARLAAVCLPKTKRPGAKWVETSGSAVSNAYARKGHTRRATRVAIERRATGWFLASATGVDIYASGGGHGRLILTAEQDREATAIFRAGYSVAQ